MRPALHGVACLAPSFAISAMRARESRLYLALSIIAPSVNVLRRTRRKPSTIRGAAPDVVIGQSTAAPAGARPYHSGGKRFARLPYVGASRRCMSRPVFRHFCHARSRVPIVFGPFHYCAFCERAAPDAPETIDDQRRCTGCRYRTIYGGSRGSASLPTLSGAQDAEIRLLNCSSNTLQPSVNVARRTV